MKLAQMNLQQYTDVLASDAPAPGGGSASALSGSQGAALTAMVAALTIGKKKYPDDQELCIDTKARAGALAQQLLLQVDRDTDAFGLVSAAFQMPKDTDEQKNARRTAIADATLKATEVPFDTMEMALKGLQLCAALVDHSNKNAASDLGVAALNLNSCLKGAWLNVCINLGGLSDEEKAAQFRSRGQEMIKQGERCAEQVYNAVYQSL